MLRRWWLVFRRGPQAVYDAGFGAGYATCARHEPLLDSPYAFGAFLAKMHEPPMRPDLDDDDGIGG